MDVGVLGGTKREGPTLGEERVGLLEQVAGDEGFMSSLMRRALAVDQAELDRVLDEGVHRVGAEATAADLTGITVAGADCARPRHQAGGG